MMSAGMDCIYVGVGVVDVDMIILLFLENLFPDIIIGGILYNLSLSVQIIKITVYFKLCCDL